MPSKTAVEAERGLKHSALSPDVSLVIPVFNEEGNLPKLHQEITEVLEPYGKRYEIIFIDDGSTDASFALLSSLRHQDPRVRVIRFRKNFGQTAALAAGFDPLSLSRTDFR